MKKVLFIDRDGTLVVEPPVDFQIDSLQKLEFLPNVFTYLGKIANELDYELVMVSNQDGLGTESFLESDFWQVQNKIIHTFENENIHFTDVYIDKSFPEENLPTRKPGTAMLSKYQYGAYDLKHSFVIGDRQTDIDLAKNLGCGSIYIGSNQLTADCSAENWASIYRYLKSKPRDGSVTRKTYETEINVTVSLDGTGKNNLKTGIGFFDHMLEQLAKHANVDLYVAVNGDLQIDEHHTIEDTAIALGTAFLEALGNKKAVARYGFLLPMDDCLAQVAIDFGGRPWLVWEADFKREMIGGMPTEMFMHFFKSFSDAAKCNLNIKAEGTNEHHKIESIFKAFAKAVQMAIQKTDNFNIPSTKGIL
jgi:imidazoleglycerol-phosphate dehydratase/histidinol-phosphatase